MFRPFRGIGLVTDGIPFDVATHRGRTLVMTSVGRRYHLYNPEQLRLLRVSDVLDFPIVCVSLQGSMEFVATKEGEIRGFYCTREVWRAQHTKVGRILSLETLTTEELLSVGTDHTICVWSQREGTLVRRVMLESNVDYTCAGLCEVSNHSILLGTFAGMVELWNYQKGENVWKSDAPYGGTGAIRSLRVCPYAPRLFAAGTENGTVVILDRVTSAEVLRLSHSDGQPIRSVDFSTELLHTIISASQGGAVNVWDLDTGALLYVMGPNGVCDSMDGGYEICHVGGCARVSFLPGTQLLLTNGEDNALRMYKFDALNGTAKHLRSRQGHYRECSFARFIDESRLCSVGLDNTLRIHHALTDLFSVEFSQGHLRRIAKKFQCSISEVRMPPITKIACCLPRKNDWACIASVHENSNIVKTWRLDKLSATKKGLELKVQPECITLSRCGHFCIVGCTDGTVHSFYLQTNTKRCEWEPALPSAPQALHVSGCNTRVISYVQSGTIFIYDLLEGKAQRSFPASSEKLLSSSVLHNDSNLLCVADGSSCISVYDVSVGEDVSNESVRIFSHHRMPITDLVLDPITRRYLISSSLDSTLCVWDLLNASLVAQYRFHHPATSISFDSNGRFLLSTHAGERGIFLWTCAIRYGVCSDSSSVRSCPPLLEYPSDGGPMNVEQPSSSGEGNVNDFSELEASNEKDKMCWSTWPKNKVCSIPYVHRIAQGSKPLLPPKKFSAPFFLPPTVPSTIDEAPNQDNKSLTHHLSTNVGSSLFSSFLLESNYEKALDYLMSLPASSICLELEGCMRIEGDDNNEDAALESMTTIEESVGGLVNLQNATNLDQQLLTPTRTTRSYLLALLDFFTYHIKNKLYRDFVEAILKYFLSEFSFSCLANKTVRGRIEQLCLVHGVSIDKVNAMHTGSMGIARNLKR